MTASIREPAEILAAIAANLRRVMRGQDAALRRLLAALAAGGHVLLEDYPGTGKTTMAKALARSIGAKFQRVQFTADLLPSDILGVSIYDQGSREFRWHEGPVFTNILLADEINRASPRTQSALLEAMAECQVSVEGRSRPLPDPFLVVATQNPVESQGIYPLPEAQMDRFMMRFSPGYVAPEVEVAVLTDQERAHPLEGIGPCASAEDIVIVRRKAAEVRVSQELKRYAVDLVGATRSFSGVRLGAGPRASLALIKAARALALLDGREFVSPDDVREAAVPVVAHRILLDPQARYSGTSQQQVVEEILRRLPVPA